MSKKSAATNVTRKSAARIPPASKADLARLRAAMAGNIDTSEIPERRTFQRLQRDANGNLPAPRSMIRDAVEREMHRLNITVYRLWQMARIHYPPLSQSAVHEFLKGRRRIELPSAEALLCAVHLGLVSKNPATKRGKNGSP